MANYANLKAAVQDVIRTNGNNEITGAVMQTALLSIINEIAAGGYLFAGMASAGGSPVVNDQNVFFIATPGTYTGYGSTVTIPQGSIGVFKYNGSWIQEVKELMNVDSYPIAGSDNLVKSSGVALEMQFRGGALQLATKIDSTYISASVGNGTTYVTIKQMLFMKRNQQSTSSYYYPPQQTLEIPQTANLVVIGVVYNPTITQDTSRYSYYTSGGDIGSFINDDECFEPIATCLVYGSSFEIRGGVLFNAIQLQDVDDEPTAGSNNLVKSDGIFSFVDIPRKFKGGLLFLSTIVDSSYIIASVGSGTTAVTIKQMLFMRRTVQTVSSYYYPQQATFNVPQDANLVVFGVIYDPKSTSDISSRYGYYTSGGYVSDMSDGEMFEPIAVCSINGNQYELRGGILFDAIQLQDLIPQKLNIANNPSIKFRGGLLLLSIQVDESYITTVDTGTEVQIIIKQMLFMRRTVQSTSSYYYPPKETLNVSRNANLVVLGVIYNPNTDQDTARYGYYTSGGDVSVLADNECFEPIALVTILNGQMTIAGSGGQFYQYLRMLKLENEVMGNTPAIKFRGGLSEIATNIDESFITCVDSGGYANVTIKRIVFMKRTVQSTSSYFYPAQTTLVFDRNVNVVVLGVIYDPNMLYAEQCRYGYYTSGGDVSQISDNECFEPIALVTILNGQMTIAGSGGKFYQYLRILKLESEVAKPQNIPSNVIYANNLKTLDGLGAISLGTGTSVPIQNAASIVSDGMEVIQYNAVLPLINTRLRDSHTRITLNTSTAEHVLFDTYGMEGGYEGLVFLATLDFANDVIRFYTNELVSYTFNQNEDYVVDFHRIDKHDTLTITRVKTGISTLIGTYNGQTRGNEGLMYDIVAIENNGGNSPIIKSYIVESSVKFPKLLIYGDSITVGYFATVSEGLNTNCYAYKVGEASGLEWQSSARGGGFFDGLLGGTSRGMSYIGRMNVELPKVRPNFVMVTIGTNGAATYSQYQSVVEKILQYGGTPIINTLPIRADNDGVHNNSEIAANNAIIMQIWKDYNLHGARLDLATSLNNDGNTINTALFDSDLIHPNDAGHQKIYERIVADCQELFY